jgi:transcriptional regulator with XRE-family HTH domain
MRSITAEYADNLREIGACITAVRKKTGITQAELAERARIHVNTMSNLERGLGDPSVTVLSLILTQLGCPGLEINKSGFHPWSPTIDPCEIIQANPLMPSFIASEIGAKICDRRLSLGLTQQELAEEAYIHPNTIWNIENGLVDASSFTIYRLYLSLGTSCIKAKGNSIEIL